MAHQHDLETQRKHKDVFFKTHAQSPIPKDERKRFGGLKYYPANDAFDLELTAEEFEDKEPIKMLTTTGDMRDFLRWGQITFYVDGQEARLTLFFSPNSGHFFLPFVDATSGKETYGAGRYLDPHQVSEGVFHVDFNLAYAPFCAYNEAYSCPIPPAENRLSVAIEAGEKNYK